MKTSLNWLRDYTEIPWSAEELAERLTSVGLEPEGIETTGTVPHGVITAKILSREPHPNSDHMSVCMVDPGTGEPVQIVCGAPNCDAGCIVPMATLGTDFGGGFVIKKSKLRGIESCGMMCSARELGLSEEHEGLLILPADTPLGVSVRDLFECDTVIDWEVTPNRPDWLSHIGIAREISAISGKPMNIPANQVKVAAGEVPASITIEAPELCPRSIGRVFRNIKVGPSPEWMKKRLEAVGLRSINNVVDITNYIMLEYGQPLHAFDLKNLAGGKIVVRRANDGEEITTLDGTKLKLSSRNLLIADGEKGVALAGIMGGENSMITDATTEVLLEAAAFDRTNIRLSARALEKHTDASYTYERGVSPETSALASERAAALLCELAGAEQVGEAIDCYPRPWQSETIVASAQRINDLLGLNFSADEIAALLERRGIKVTAKDGDAITVATPWWRFDLHKAVDLAEEIAQMAGLDAIPDAAAPALAGGSIGDDKFFPQEKLRNQLLGEGLTEILNYTMWSEAQCLAGTSLTAEEILRVSNPISADSACLRPTMLPGILQVIQHNVNRNNHDLALFEMGRIFRMNDGKPQENLQIAIALTGRKHPERFGQEKAVAADFYDLKGLLEGWLDANGLENFYRAEPAEHPAFQKGACARIIARNKKELAVFGAVDSKLTKGMRNRNPIFIALVDAEALLTVPRPARKFSGLPQFPGVERDISFLAPAELTNLQVTEAIRSLKIPGMVKVELFDLFEDAKVLGAGKRSLAYTVTYQDPARTLTDDEVNKLQEKLREGLVKKLGVELR
ncbi:MAG: phenylalanine--tRNA ligase subunit beta [Victivallales bacterium]|nr:phenylalanine--tRNA ligase subunit beta [Victivallales bacterium]